MTTNSVLDEAESRIAPAAARAQATRQAIIEEMRREIGEKNYEEAKLELPKLELLLSREIRPYLSRLTKIAQCAIRPLPGHIAQYVRELEETCSAAPDWVRVGIAEWNGLQAPFAKGSQEIDFTRRSEEIGSVRMRLRSWSGRESRARDLMDSINSYIKDSGWPMAQTVGSGTIVQAREESREIVVERAF